MLYKNFNKWLIYFQISHLLKEYNIRSTTLVFLMSDKIKNLQNALACQN